MFASTTNLRYLYLTSFRIRKIIKNAFYGLKGLKNLSLAYNQSKDLRNVSFENLLYLKLINVRNDFLNILISVF